MMLRQNDSKAKTHTAGCRRWFLLLALTFLFITTSGAAADTPSVVGTWNWVGGQILVVNDNNTQVVWWDNYRVNEGTWEVLNQATRQYRFHYTNGGWVDTVTLSADGNTLEGTNQQGTYLKGTRRR